MSNAPENKSWFQRAKDRVNDATTWSSTNKQNIEKEIKEIVSLENKITEIKEPADKIDAVNEILERLNEIYGNINRTDPVKVFGGLTIEHQVELLKMINNERTQIYNNFKTKHLTLIYSVDDIQNEEYYIIMSITELYTFFNLGKYKAGPIDKGELGWKEKVYTFKTGRDLELSKLNEHFEKKHLYRFKLLSEEISDAKQSNPTPHNTVEGEGGCKSNRKKHKLSLRNKRVSKKSKKSKKTRRHRKR